MIPRKPPPARSLDAVLDSIRSIGDLEGAIDGVYASGHLGPTPRMASTPVCFIWTPTLAEWEAAAERQQAPYRPHGDPPAPPPPRHDELHDGGPGSVPYPFGGG